jgi:hypothetical protein
MTSDHEDDWAELARELECDIPSAKEPALGETAPANSSMPTETNTDQFEQIGAHEQTEDAVASDHYKSDFEGDENQPGFARKRRRRRRRRRKSNISDTHDSPSEQRGTAEVQDNETSDSEDQSAEIDSSFDEEFENETAIEMPRSDGNGDDDIGAEVLRDLIANWNVPSWDEVVASLYRPER